MLHLLHLLTLLLTFYFNGSRVDAQLIPLVRGKAGLPVLQNPLFNLRSAEKILQSQLGAWGAKINLDLDVDLKLDLLGLDILKRGKDERRSRGERGLLGLNLGGKGGDQGLDLGLDLDLGLGLNNADLDLGAGLGALDVGTTLKAGKWGQADAVAKGERGDTAWYTYITIGDPPQSVPIIPDTGSADLFVYSSTCSTCQLSNHSSFNPQASRTFTNLTRRWSVEYHDESGARGYIGTDTISFGAAGSLDTRLGFAVATTLQGQNIDSAASGIMGLSLDDLSTMPDEEYNKGATLFSRLVKTKKLAENVLGIRMEKGQASQGVMYKEGGGMYTFGGMENGYVVGGKAGLAWVPVSSSLYWGFSLDGISVGTKSVIGSNDTTQKRAMVDTGTTLILTSTEIATALHSQIAGSVVSKSSGIFYIPCTTSYPRTQNIFINLGGQRFGIPIEDLAWKTSSFLEGMCISGVQGGVPQFTVLGDIFIKNHYIVLSYGDEKQSTQRSALGGELMLVSSCRRRVRR